MFNGLKIIQDDCGAVTVDWIVLCGALVALAVGAAASVEAALEDGAGSAVTKLTSVVDTTIGAADTDAPVVGGNIND